MSTALYLDLDASVDPLPGVEARPLAAWQGRIRYGATWSTFDRFERDLDLRPERMPGVTFLGSGDFHHLTYLLLRQHASRGPFQIVVLDNHPDNMRFPWGIHCGSWVHHASRLPFVSHITVAGIASDDIGWMHAWEHHLGSLRAGRVSYLCLHPVPGYARLLGIHGMRDLRTRQDLLPRILEKHVLGLNDDPVYLSIDKDVLSTCVVRTNWDQGVLTREQLLESVRRLRPRVFASDVTGEPSFHTYTTGWKGLLSRLDAQRDAPDFDLREARQRQQALNRELLALLAQG